MHSFHQYCDGRWWQLSALLISSVPARCRTQWGVDIPMFSYAFHAIFALLPFCMFECKYSMFLAPSGILISFPQWLGTYSQVFVHRNRPLVHTSSSRSVNLHVCYSMYGSCSESLVYQCQPVVLAVGFLGTPKAPIWASFEAGSYAYSCTYIICFPFATLVHSQLAQVVLGYQLEPQYIVFANDSHPEPGII